MGTKKNKYMYLSIENVSRSISSYFTRDRYASYMKGHELFFRMLERKRKDNVCLTM